MCQELTDDCSSPNYRTDYEIESDSLGCVVENGDEIQFEKYQRKGAYHWDEISHDPRKANAVTIARYRMCLKLLEEKLDGIEGKTILDFGCGDGALTYEMFKKGAKVTGVDLSALAIELGRNKHLEKGSTAKLFVGSCYDTGFKDSSFDGLISSDVIEHVRDVDCFCKELKRNLVPSGVAVISTPIKLTAIPVDRNHVQEWFEEDFQAIIRRHFHTVSFYRSHPVFWMELFNRSQRFMMLINLTSIFSNPFMSSFSWRLYAMQYAICTKDDL